MRVVCLMLWLFVVVVFVLCLLGCCCGMLVSVCVAVVVGCCGAFRCCWLFVGCWCCCLLRVDAVV